MFDQGSDIAIIVGFYNIYLYESNTLNDCNGINGFWLFVASLCSFLLYRVVSSIAVYIGTKNIYYAFGQFICEAMLYRSIWVNYISKTKDPCSSQKWLLSMEAMTEGMYSIYVC